MNTNRRCGAPTKSGGSCRWNVPCKYHGGDAANEPLDVAEGVDIERTLPPPETWERRSLHELGWWVAEQVLKGGLEARQAGVLVSLLRVLHALGPTEMSREDALAEIELRGRIMNGFAPRDAEEWARAERTFDDDAIAEFRRWDALLVKGDPAHDRDPLVDGDGLAREEEVAGFVYEQH